MNDMTSNDLVVSLPADALAVFTAPGAIDPILNRIRKELDGFSADISSAAGRKAVASMAYKVARAKTYLDEEGKALVAKQKEIPNKIDATRKHLRDTLDKWKDEVRAPLTKWEADEAARVDRIKASLAELDAVSNDQVQRASDVMRERLAEIEAEALTEQFYQEHLAVAVTLKERAISTLKARILDAEKREAEQAELERLRAAELERKQKERDEQIAREAAARAEQIAAAKADAARLDAEAAARREREASERRELELRLKAEQAERRAAEADAKARQAVEAKAKAEAEEIARREADTKHRERVNSDALAAFVAAGIAEEIATFVVTLIAQKAIPNVQMRY